MFQEMPTLQLTAAERDSLHACLSDENISVDVAKKAKAILLCESGKSTKDILSTVGYKKQQTISKAINDFKSNGVDGLKRAQYSLRNSAGSELRINVLKDFLDNNPLNNGEKWTVNDLELKVNTSRSNTYNVINKLIDNDSKYLNNIAIEKKNVKEDNTLGLELDNSVIETSDQYAYIKLEIKK